jgi:hypothetical protein
MRDNVVLWHVGGQTTRLSKGWEVVWLDAIIQPIIYDGRRYNFHATQVIKHPSRPMMEWHEFWFRESAHSRL